MQNNSEIAVNNVSDYHDKFEFDYECFRYVVEYTSKQIKNEQNIDSINIRCTHKTEFYAWTFTTSEEIKNYGCPSVGQLVHNITINPKMLYTILKNFYLGKLSKMFELKFPSGYKMSDVELIIEIVTLIEYSEYRDIKVINMKPCEIDEVRRQSLIFDHKINSIKQELINTQQEVILIRKELNNKQEFGNIKQELYNIKQELKNIYQELKNIQMEWNFDKKDICPKKEEAVFKLYMEHYLKSGHNKNIMIELLGLKQIYNTIDTKSINKSTNIKSNETKPIDIKPVIVKNPGHDIRRQIYSNE
ncbi:hypothetical protein [Powai lake megavirus]|uniref:Uncharacterized protein n=1 Tax=Powai lake megavirus TaxID=1842663 RepID=A0A161HUV7_9VIRU|nr:hypothetical protein QJ849_gp738 [Powai lake megavirus]ANB50900.1 hypothetical protein [Powai lake megavirus]